MKINSFEDLLVWQKARELTKIIYKLTAAFLKEEKYNLFDQIWKGSYLNCSEYRRGFFKISPKRKYPVLQKCERFFCRIKESSIFMIYFI